MTLRPRPRSLRLAAGLAAVVALAGCSRAAEIEQPPAPAGVNLEAIDIADETANGLWFVDGPTALQRVIDAVRAAGGARMSGWLVESVPVEDAEPVAGRRIDLAVTGTPSAYSAQLALQGQEIELVVVDGAAFLRGNAAYAQRVGDERFASGFVCLTADDALVAEWSALTDPAELLDGALGSAELGIHAPAEGAPTTELVIGAGGAPVGALTVSAVYAPLPSRLVIGDVSGNASIDFAAWGETDAVTAPEDVAVDCG